MEKFEELSQEKQRRIIDAGMEVFGRYEYKKANTEDIAVKAGISKGLLFYYFKDKKKLLYVSVSVLCNYHHKDAG
ncbi:MAG: TetR/AcrR family transcriptional regulator [[Clostridium] innocuum]